MFTLQTHFVLFYFNIDLFSIIIEKLFTCILILKCLEQRFTIFTFYKEFGNDPILIWTPVIEEDYGQERFLTDDPVKLIKEGHFLNIPIVAGITKNEFDQRAFGNKSIFFSFYNLFF